MTEQSFRIDLESTVGDPAAARLTPSTLAPPPALADRYKVSERIGRGATGDVFVARDRTFDREVAVKVMLPTTDGRRLAGFIREARVTANLAHPGIVPVYDLDFGMSGTPYFTMRRISGTSLGDVLRQIEAGQPPAEVATLADRVTVVRKVCDALACAHDQGVIHQDVKPDNIMVGQYGEVFLVDWGTASESGDSSSSPRPVAGTPAYMAPEQARGQAVDVRSDVYAVGATLFHLLIGRLPLRTDDADRFWERKQRGELDALSAAERSKVPKLLRAIVRKALAADQAERYADAGDLSADLGRWQAGLPVAAHRENLLEQGCRFTRRHWRGLGMAAAALGLLVATGVTSYLAQQQTVAHWGEPLLQEDFQDSSWQARWTPMTGAWSSSSGALVSEGESANFLLLDRRLAGATAVEFTGTSLAGFPVCDLSIGWVPGDRPVANASNSFITSPMVLAQVGAYDNSFAQITSTNQGQGRQYDYRLEVGRPYRIRVEMEEGLIRMLVDGVEIARHQDAIPSAGGWLMLYAYYPGKQFDDVVIHAKGLPPRLPATALGDAAMRMERWDEAVAAYHDVITSDRDADLVDQARFRKGLAHLRADRPVEATKVWADLRTGPYASAALEARCRLAWKNGAVEEALGLLTALVAVNQDTASGVWCELARNKGDSAVIWTAQVSEQVLAFRRAHLPVTEDVGAAGCELHQRRGTVQDVLAEFGSSRLARGMALSELGRNREILGDPQLTFFQRSEAALRLGDFARLAAEFPEAHVANAKALFVQGQPQRILDARYMPTTYRALALVDLGRGAELATLFPGQDLAGYRFLARAGRLAEVMAASPSAYGQQAAFALDDLEQAKRHQGIPADMAERQLIGVRAFEAGDVAVAAANYNALSTFATSGGPALLLMPWVAGLAGQPGQPEAAWSALLKEDRSWIDYGRLAAIVKVIRGADPAILDQLPAVTQRPTAHDLATALRAEQQQDWVTARSAWARLAALQPGDRWPDWDPLMVRIAAARVTQLAER